jgi:phospholipase/lecithinase/hemolysin
MRASIVSLFSVAVFIVAWGQPSSAAITSLVGFGDSLTDTGRIGRFSDDVIWIEQLASGLGVPVPISSNRGGSNYAFGGATTGDTTIAQDMDQQVANYLNFNTPSGQELFVLWGGHNDLFGGIAPTTIVANLSSEVSLLFAAGARQFMVPNLAPVDLTPREKGGPNEATLAAAVAQTNSLLAAELDLLDSTLPGSLFLRTDMHGLILDMYADFAIFGSGGIYGYENVTEAALLTGGDFITHLWLDPIHPTSKTHAFIGNFAAATVPEPSSLLLLTLGSLTLLYRIHNEYLICHKL